MLRMLQWISPCFQWRQLTCGDSARHGRDMDSPFEGSRKPVKVRRVGSPPMNAPRAEREAAALMYATRWFLQTQEGTSAKTSTANWRFWTKLSVVREIVTTDESPRTKNYQRSASTSRWNENALVKLIADARAGDADARAVLRDLSRELIDREEPPIGPLKEYLTEDALADSPPKPKRQTPNAHANSSRDANIANLIERVRDLFDLRPTRCPNLVGSKDPNEQSVCSIVAKAARGEGIKINNGRGKPMTELDIVGIWTRRR
jgi:hypothetical protein